MSEGAPVECQLALEIRSWKFGYAVVEGSSLLDWGVCQFPSGKAAPAIRRIAFIVKIYAPSIAVARSVRRVDDESSKRASGILRQIRTELDRRSLRFLVLARLEVRKFFAARGCHTKHDIAAVVVENFGQLRPRMPKLRKPWEPEESIATVFDAVATAIAFKGLQHAAIPQPAAPM